MERRSWSLDRDARNKMVIKITDTLQKAMPVRGSQSVDELKNIAVRYEEKIYAEAADQEDYLWRISTKMISFEAKTQVPRGNTSN